MKTKICFKCHQIKPLSEFYKHSKTADGHVNKCKECNKKDVSLNYRKNIQHYTQYEQKRAILPHRVQARKIYSKTEGGIKSHKKAQVKYRTNNPEKYKAANVVNNAVRDNRLHKQPCFICGKIKVHGHHYDYNKPLSVIWLCPEHHNWMHKRK